MSNIQFISHEFFPDDDYTKELVYLCLDGKYRVAYVRKSSKNGGLFWSVVSLGVSKNGRKEYFPSFMQDSSFLEQDIRRFLENRSWENQNITNQKSFEKQNSMDEVSFQHELPF